MAVKLGGVECRKYGVRAGGDCCAKASPRRKA
jgi:hypothetical protein